MINRIKQRPLYIKAKEEIKRFIDESGLEDGDMLPPEGKLCERLGISRGTLREAMRALEEEELVIRKQGIGTYVTHSEQLISSTLDINEGVTEMIRGKNMVPGSRNVVIEELKASQKIAKVLSLKVGEFVTLIKRVRTANDIPVAYTEDYIPAKHIPETVLKNIGEGSLYTLLEDRFNIALASSLLRLMPIKASRVMAKELSIKQGDLLLFLQQTDAGNDGVPILYSEEYFVSQRFEFVVMRKRRRA
jgi:GntR family transcriptional regulator